MRDARSQVSVIAFVAITALSLAGCGSSASETSPRAATTPTTSPTTAPPERDADMAAPQVTLLERLGARLAGESWYTYFQINAFAPGAWWVMALTFELDASGTGGAFRAETTRQDGEPVGAGRWRLGDPSPGDAFDIVLELDFQDGQVPIVLRDRAEGDLYTFPIDARPGPEAFSERVLEILYDIPNQGLAPRLEGAFLPAIATELFEVDELVGDWVKADGGGLGPGYRVSASDDGGYTIAFGQYGSVRFDLEYEGPLQVQVNDEDKSVFVAEMVGANGERLHIAGELTRSPSTSEVSFKAIEGLGILPSVVTFRCEANCAR